MNVHLGAHVPKTYTYVKKKKLLKLREITKIAAYTSLEGYSNTQAQSKMRGKFVILKAYVVVYVSYFIKSQFYV